MGYYTDLFLKVHIKDNSPRWVGELLSNVNDLGERIPPEIAQDPLFSLPRWASLFAYVGRYHAEFDELVLYCSFKDYGDEIRHFLNLLAPHVYSSTDGPGDRAPWDFCGYVRGEGQDVPTLIYHSRGRFMLIDDETPDANGPDITWSWKAAPMRDDRFPNLVLRATAQTAQPPGVKPARHL